MRKRSKFILSAVLVIITASVMLMFDVPTPSPEDAQAQRRGSMPFAIHFDSKTWVKGTDWNAEALSFRAKWWTLTIKVGSNAADSVQIKIHETYSGEWTTLSFLGEVVEGSKTVHHYNGPEIDSVEVFTGTLGHARIDYWK